MDLAIEVAKKGAAKLEVPVGAVVVHRKTQAIIAKSYNKVEAKNSPLLHAEILALNLASKKLSSRYLQDCDLYTTLEPCPLCAAAISAYRIGRLYYGLQDPKFGAVESASQFYNSKNCFHKPEIYSGIHEEKIRILMKNFFHKIRATKQKEVFRCCS
ncbi:MAG: nucleoside deaminase [Alphaproteobacteria bacterium]|nr:nucleoside deaminase [Alphaproteobacteria bacterium]